MSCRRIRIIINIKITRYRAQKQSEAPPLWFFVHIFESKSELIIISTHDSNIASCTFFTANTATSCITAA